MCGEWQLGSNRRAALASTVGEGGGGAVSVAYGEGGGGLGGGGAGDSGERPEKGAGRVGRGR